MDRNLQIIGLAKKAGLLAVGAEDSGSAARSKKAHIIISANDSSDNSLRRASSSAEIGQVLHIIVPYTSFELGSVSGRGSPGTVAILDLGLAARFMRGLAETDPERYRVSAEILSTKAGAKADKRKANRKKTDMKKAKTTWKGRTNV